MTRLPARIRPLALPAALLLAALVQPAAALADTLHVDAASTTPAASCGATAAPCATIDDALDRATAGDVLVLAPGDHAGATIDVPVQLRGAQVGTTGAARGIDRVNGRSVIRGSLVLQATVTIDGLDFRTPTGPALHVAAPLPGRGTGASLVRNSTFAGVGGTHVVNASSAIGGITLSDNLFVGATGGAHVALFVHGEHVPGGIENVVVERNEFRDFAGHADAAVLDAGGVPGLRVRANTVIDSGSLLVLSDSDGSSQRILVQDNLGSGFIGHAIRLGRGVVGATIERNRIAGATGAALRIADGRGTGTSSDLLVRANDITDVRSAVSAADDVLAGALVVRGNRIVATSDQNVVVSSITSGSIDARRNWWGRSAGLADGAVNGPADVTEPLRLVGVDAPAAVLVNGSGVASVRLVGAVGSGPEADAAGFPVTFAADGSSLDASQVTLAFGSASTLFTAGATAGSTTVTATLDGEQVRATVRILAAGSQVPAGLAEPSSAEAAPPRAGKFTAVVARTGRLSRALSAGLQQVVVTNRPSSVRTTYMVSHYTAKLLGLRPRTSPTREPFVIAKVRTRALTGRRVVTARIAPRPRFAIARYPGRVEVMVVTHVRTKSGAVRRSWRRIVLPSKVR